MTDFKRKIIEIGSALRLSGNHGLGAGAINEQQVNRNLRRHAELDRMTSHIKTLRIQSGDVVLLEGSFDHDTIMMLVKAIKSLSLEGVMICCLDPDESIERMDETEMLKYGWIRKPTLNSLPKELREAGLQSVPVNHFIALLQRGDIELPDAFPGLILHLVDQNKNLTERLNKYAALYGQLPE